MVAPLLTWAGDSWEAGELRISHEHLMSAVVKKFLAGLYDANNVPEGAPVIVISTPRGQQHEMGAQMAAVEAVSAGWHVKFFGSNLPAAELARAARDLGARAVALSVIYPGDDPYLIEEMRELRTHVPDNLPILVGGSGARAQRTGLEKIGLRFVSDLYEFRTQLRRTRVSTRQRLTQRHPLRSR